MQIDRSNTQLKLTVSDLRLKLRTKDKEMHKEMLKVSTYLKQPNHNRRFLRTLFIWSRSDIKEN